MNTVFVIGIIAGGFTCISMFPQVIKIIKKKKATDVSLVMPLVLFIGHGLWITYGIMRSDIPLIIPNCIAIILDGVLILLTIRYGKRATVKLKKATP